MPTPVARDATAPRCFAHDLPDELFSSDALDEICRAAAARDQLTVQIPDSSRERLGQRPELTQPRYPILQDALERPVHYRIFNTAIVGPAQPRGVPCAAVRARGPACRPR